MYSGSKNYFPKGLFNGDRWSRGSVPPPQTISYSKKLYSRSSALASATSLHESPQRKNWADTVFGFQPRPTGGGNWALSGQNFMPTFHFRQNFQKGTLGTLKSSQSSESSQMELLELSAKKKFSSPKSSKSSIWELWELSAQKIFLRFKVPKVPFGNFWNFGNFRPKKIFRGEKFPKFPLGTFGTLRKFPKFHLGTFAPSARCRSSKF